MILRRFIEHVKEQNWTAIALDFIIVVSGVFIGIQVSNWNAARGDAARAQKYLVEIAANLETDYHSYKDHLDYWARTMDYGMQGLRYARDGGGEPVWPVVLAFFQASQVAELWPERTAFDELKASGDFRLIGNAELRKELSSYYINAVNPTLTVRPAYREHVRERIPIEIQRYIWRNCYGATPDGRQTFIDCSSPVDESVAAEVADRLAGDETLLGELAYWLSTLEAASIIAEFQADNAAGLRERVLAAAGASHADAAP